VPEPPPEIDGFTVVEYGFFPAPTLPVGYVPPPDGRSPLEPVQNLAICIWKSVDGFYLLFCTADWRYVTSCFNETMEYTKGAPRLEFGQDVDEWRKRA
jgi:hypothetical protein